jgi:hypothetical protein
MSMEKEPARINTGVAPRTTARVRSLALQAMNERELGAIYSLFAWVAAEQDTVPETVRAITEARFETRDVIGLPARDYDEVIRFLMDLRIDEMRD